MKELRQSGFLPPAKGTCTGKTAHKFPGLPNFQNFLKIASVIEQKQLNAFQKWQTKSKFRRYLI